MKLHRDSGTGRVTECFEPEFCGMHLGLPRPGDRVRIKFEQGSDFSRRNGSVVEIKSVDSSGACSFVQDEVSSFHSTWLELVAYDVPIQVLGDYEVTKTDWKPSWKPGDGARLQVPDPIPGKFYAPGDWAKAMRSLNGRGVTLRRPDAGSLAFIRKMSDGIEHVSIVECIHDVPVEWLVPIKGRREELYDEDPVLWRARAISAEAARDAAVLARDADRAQFERERDSFAGVVRETVLERDAAVHELKALRLRHEETLAREAALVREIGKLTGERAKLTEFFNLGCQDCHKTRVENLTLIKAAEGRAEPCFMCTPLVVHAQRLRARGEQFRLRLQESADRGFDAGVRTRQAVGRLLRVSARKAADVACRSLLPAVAGAVLALAVASAYPRMLYVVRDVESFPLRDVESSQCPPPEAWRGVAPVRSAAR